LEISIDLTDIKILAALQADACLQNTELAKKLGMAPSAVLERVKKLELKGIIQAYNTRINPEVLDLKLLAFVFIKTSEGPGNVAVAKQLVKIPDVLELHHIAGEDCYLMKVRSKDPLSLIHFMREKMSKIPGILSTKTTIVLETLKEDNYLPIPKPTEWKKHSP
jgi:Lrp/AsnC family leucine-responsive transcriptional regulator